MECIISLNGDQNMNVVVYASNCNSSDEISINKQFVICPDSQFTHFLQWL